MWEFSLACANKNEDIIEYINQCFCSSVPECMLTSYKDDCFTYLLFACDERISGLCKDKIKQCIVTYIIDVYKYEYFTKRIAKNNQSNLILNAYIKALTLYDVETDVALIRQSFEIDKQLHLDRFIDFRLTELYRMWQELCDLVISNTNHLSREMMIDVIKSFIATFTPSCNTLKIIIEKDCFVLYKIDNNMPPIKLKDQAPAIDVINYALLSNPNHIEIYGQTKDNFGIISLLKSLYQEKVKIL